MAQTRGTTVSAKSYSTSDTDILSFQASHNIKQGTVFYIFPSTVGTAKVHYKDPSGTFRELQSTACAANDLTVISFSFPISDCKLTYVGTSAGGTVNAEGRSF